MVVRGPGSTALTMHHEKQPRKIWRVDFDRHAVRQADQRLGSRMRDLEKCVDCPNGTYDLDCVWTVYLGNSVDGFIEIPRVHKRRPSFPITPAMPKIN